MMRIAQVAPLWEPVPPPRYGAVETLVADLTEELTQRRHQVTVFASGDSTVTGLVPTCPRALNHTSPISEPEALRMLQMRQVLDRAAEFDIIHSHIHANTGCLGLLALADSPTPVVHTIHCFFNNDNTPLFMRFAGQPFVAISGSQRSRLPTLNYLATIHHGVDTPEEPLARWEQLLDASRNLAVSPFSVLLASYARLITRLTTSTTVIIGMITSARNDTRFAATIGPFTAPFPVPIVVDGRSPSELVQQCHRLVTGITARSSYPVTDLPTVAPAFAGFPADTYFTDTCINFTNYRREQAHHEPRVFGEPEIVHPAEYRARSHSHIRVQSNVPGLGINYGGTYWHSDGPWSEVPTAATDGLTLARKR